MSQLDEEARPDFFIIGTMKGGTTILYDFICSHPSVTKAKEKEIHYFSLYPEKGLDWYLSHFDFVPGKITGEASPSYFDVAYTDAIPKCIQKLNPNAKIILITRDPVERTVSHFFHLQNISKIPAIKNVEINFFFSHSFQDCLKQLSHLEYLLQQTLYFSCYTRKLITYRSIFSKNQLLILDNNELRQAPQHTMDRVFKFLDLPPFESTDFKNFKYSSGQDSSVLTPEIKKKLSDFLYSDYTVYCKEAGIKFNEPIKSKPQISGDVLIGQDDWLFLVGGSNSPLDYYLNRVQFSEKQSNDWCELLGARQQKLKGIRYIHLIVPNKETIYDHKTGLDSVLAPGNPLTVLFRNASSAQKKILDDTCINPIVFFKRIRDDVQLYWKTDSHWSFSGCYAAYQLICSKLGIAPINDLINRPFTEGTIGLDLGSKLTPPIKEKVRFYNLCKDSYCSETNELVDFKKQNKIENEAGLHVGSRVKFTNPNAQQKQKIMIFGDSFAEYRPSLLTGMLAETFEETHFIWSSSLDYAFIEEISPDIVLTELVERFMPVVPRDSFDVKEFPIQRIKEFTKNQTPNINLPNNLLSR